MREPLQATITRLLRYQRAPGRATRLFRTWKHNADILSRLQAQIEMILNAYGKFEPIVYDTQGIHDDGTDIALRYRPEGGDTEFELICMQVKSFDDLQKKTYLQELKAQRHDSFQKVIGLKVYLILLCTDSDIHREKIRSINAAFRSADRTEVIEPSYVYTFLHHPKTRIEAIIKRSMEADDLVFRLALDSLDMPSPSAKALLVFLAVKATLSGNTDFTVSQLLTAPMLRAIYDELREIQAAALEQSMLQQPTDNARPDDEDEDEDSYEWDDEEDEPPQIGEFQDQISADLEYLEGDVDFDSASGNVRLHPDQLRPLLAVITDALARYEYSEQELMSYMFNVMGVRE